MKIPPKQVEVAVNQADEFNDMSLDSSQNVAWSCNEGVHVQRPNQRSLNTLRKSVCGGNELGRYSLEVFLSDPKNLHLS